MAKAVNIFPLKNLLLRIDKRDCIKLKSFCTSRKIVTRMKRQPTEWGKIFASYLLGKKLIFIL
jgi:hypothetical protein